MDNFIELKIKELKCLKDKFKVDYTLHLSTISTIEMFITRFSKHPHWLHKVKFYSYQNDWQDCGSFILILNGGEQVYFNTLEEFPHYKFKRAIIAFEFNNKTTFINIRDGLRHLLSDIIRIHHFDIIKDISTRSLLLSKASMRNVELDIPEEFYLSSLKVEHAEKINNAWKGKFNGSKQLIIDAITLNTSMGIFRKSDDYLVGWNMRFDTGAMSVGAIDKKFEGFQLARLAILGLAKKICDKFDTDVFFEVVHGNEIALNLTRYLVVIDTQSWISVIRKKTANYAIWGHL